MKKLFLIVLAIAMTAAFTMPAMATQSRVAALGGAGQYLEDDFNIFDWPATLPSYSNMVWIELMTEQYYFGGDCWDDIYCDHVIPAIGASYGLGEDGGYGTLAMFFHETSEPLHPLWNSYWPIEWSTGPIYASPSYNKFHIMYGYAMEGLSFGLRFTMASEKYRFEDGFEDEWSSGATTIAGGVRFDVGEAGYMDLNAEIGWGAFADSFYAGYAVSEDANMYFDIKARMFYEWNETITWVPYFRFLSYDFSTMSDDDAYTDFYWGDKGMGFEFGVGANVTVNEDNLLLFALEPYKTFKREPSAIPDGVDGEFTSTMRVFPGFVMGLESDIKDWLTFRMGGTHQLIKVKDESCNEDPDGTCEWSWSEFDYYMGLGFHVGDWDVDCVLQNVTPFRLGYWLTGMGQYMSEEETAFWMISAKYHF
jgi:hypothetical protein